MIVLAHIEGVPVEELLMAWFSGGIGAASVAALFSSVVGLALRTHGRRPLR